MKRDSLPKDLREKLDRLKIPTLKELKETLKRLTPEQRNLIDSEIARASMKFRRSLFRLIPGGRRRS
jgi:hypothetical protein